MEGKAVDLMNRTAGNSGLGRCQAVRFGGFELHFARLRRRRHAHYPRPSKQRMRHGLHRTFAVQLQQLPYVPNPTIEGGIKCQHSSGVRADLIR